jgi:hypothetical protein
LPDVPGDDNLWLHPIQDISAKDENPARSVWPQLKHFNRVTKIEMKNLIRLKSMDSGESFGRE